MRIDGNARRRGGYVYLAVLFTTLIVAASVAGALSISTSNIAAQNDRNHRFAALRLAESELHRWAAALQSDASWRTKFENNVFTQWYTPTINGVAIEDARLRGRFSDSDGSLSDDDFDSVVLTIDARMGDSAAAISATLQPNPTPYDVLRYSVTTTDDLSLDNAAALSCEKPVQVYDDCKSFTDGVLTTPLLESNDELEFALRGDRGIDSLELTTRNVLNDYIARGTEISVTSIPWINSRRVIRNVILSPTSNPYGKEDPNGIYWFDAAGATVRIRNSRLLATLVIRNAAEIEIRESVIWEYPTTADAILISDSNIGFDNINQDLDEGDMGTNFNPSGSPYRGIYEDGDTGDSYATQLRGIIYTEGDIEVYSPTGNSFLHLTGSLVCHDLNILGGRLHVHQLDEILVNPPPGMCDPTPMRFVRGSFRQVPTP